MYIANRDVAKMMSILADIRNEGKKERPRRHRVENLTDRISLIIRKAQKKQINQINF